MRASTMSADSQWDQAAQDDERSAWVRKAMAIAEPFAVTGSRGSSIEQT